MARRWRVRRVLKWAGSILVALILAVAFAELHWSASYCTDHIGLQLLGGKISFYWTVEAWSSDSPRGLSIGRCRDLSNALDYCSANGVLPRGVALDGAGAVSVPLWILLALTGAPTALLWWSDGRRAPPGHCRRCGYDLTGNVSGRCPECGASVPSRPADVPQQKRQA